MGKYKLMTLCFVILLVVGWFTFVTALTTYCLRSRNLQPLQHFLPLFFIYFVAGICCFMAAKIIYELSEEGEIQACLVEIGGIWFFAIVAMALLFSSK